MISSDQGHASGVAAARRRLAVGAGLKLAGVAVLDFVLLRLWVPDLVNMHADWALAAGLACLAVAIVATGWLGVQLWTARSRWIGLEPRARSRAAEWRDR